MRPIERATVLSLVLGGMTLMIYIIGGDSKNEAYHWYEVVVVTALIAFGAGLSSSFSVIGRILLGGSLLTLINLASDIIFNRSHAFDTSYIVMNILSAILTALFLPLVDPPINMRRDIGTSTLKFFVYYATSFVQMLTFLVVLAFFEWGYETEIFPIIAKDTLPPFMIIVFSSLFVMSAIIGWRTRHDSVRLTLLRVVLFLGVIVVASQIKGPIGGRGYVVISCMSFPGFLLTYAFGRYRKQLES